MTKSMFLFTSTAGLRYHVMSAEERRQSNLHNLKPRRKKYDYRVAVLGGSEENTCQYFNCKGNFLEGCAEIRLGNLTLSVL